MFHHHAAAERALFRRRRLVPAGKIALRVAAAPVEQPAATRLARNDVALVALGARHANFFQNGLGVAAFRKARAGQKLAVAAFLDHHAAAAFFAHHVAFNHDRRSGHNFLIRHLQQRVERFVELLQRFQHGALVFRNLVQFCLQLRAVRNVDDLTKILHQQLHHLHAQVRRQ